MKILIVEDEPMILKGISYLVNNYAYEYGRKPEIVEACGGIEGEHYLQTETFQIVFTDIRMPDIDGLTLLKKWRTTSPGTQWVIISGYEDFKYAQEAIVNGVKDYLLKPVTKQKMNQTLNRLISEYKHDDADFVGVDESERMLDELLEAIWMLDEHKIQTFTKEWFAILNKRNMEMGYLVQFFNQLLKALYQKLNAKSNFQLEGFQYIIDAKDLATLEHQCCEACIQLQTLLRKKRNANMIVPIDAAKKYIEEHLGEPVSLEDIARMIGFNTTYFSQMFKRETGESFVAFRKRLRMEKAKQLLEEGQMKIIDISNEIGYGDLPHFTKTFKQYTGYTPSEYRAKLGID